MLRAASLLWFPTEGRYDGEPIQMYDQFILSYIHNKLIGNGFEIGKGFSARVKESSKRGPEEEVLDLFLLWCKERF